ncbi:MAG: outer membrane protein assembly factor BamB, partial [Abditibacteriota bacterium]|nr:outer membrane protein assembly factor BamB [Abditibacteriota bacterium]
YMLSDFSLRAKPLVRNETAWAASEEGVLSALSWKTGRVRWRRSGRAAITTQPASLLVPAPASAQATPRPGATSAPTSSAAATEAGASGNANAGVNTPSPPRSAALSQQLILFCGNDEGVIEAVRASDGKVLWTRPMRAPVGNGLSLASGWKAANGQDATLLLVPLLGGVLSRGGVRALDVKTGREAWRYPADAKVYAAQLPAPVVFQSEGQTRVLCVDDSGAVSCLDARSGRKIWKSFVTPLEPADSNLVMLRCDPKVLSFASGQRVFVGGNDGGVRCFDARNGRLLWSFDAGHPVRGALQLFDIATATTALSADESIELSRAALAVGTDGPVVWLLSANDGRPLARAATSTGLKHGVWIADKQLISIGRETVEAFSLSNLPATS